MEINLNLQSEYSLKSKGIVAEILKEVNDKDSAYIKPEHEQALLSWTKQY